MRDLRRLVIFVMANHSRLLHSTMNLGGRTAMTTHRLKPHRSVAWVWVLSLVFAAALFYAPRAGAKPKKKAVHVVTMRLMKFEPPELTVKAGDTVEWVNEDILPHTATASGRFDSGPINAKQKWRWTAKEKGTFPYVCSLHPTMKATLIVQ
jgi:plastocyanin